MAASGERHDDVVIDASALCESKVIDINEMLRELCWFSNDTVRTRTRLERRFPAPGFDDFLHFGPGDWRFITGEIEQEAFERRYAAYFSIHSPGGIGFLSMFYTEEDTFGALATDEQVMVAMSGNVEEEVLFCAMPPSFYHRVYIERIVLFLPERIRYAEEWLKRRHQPF